MTEGTQRLGDAHGDWYYCFKHGRVERRSECDEMDRMGPYPSREAAEDWRSKVAERNQEWGDDED